MKHLILLTCLLWTTAGISQVAINTDGTTPDNSAMLDVKSGNKGILIPRMTQTERNAIVSPATGLMIFQTDNTPGFYYNSGTSGAPNWKLVGDGTLTLPYSGNYASSGDVFRINNTGTGTGLTGTSIGATGKGVLGISFGGSIGVEGQGANSGAIGVKGFGTSATGINYGVYGITPSVEGFGVYGTAPVTAVKGMASNSSGINYGIYGESASPDGYGVYGKASATSGNATGIYGESGSSLGTGVCGKLTAASGFGIAVSGICNSDNGTGVSGIATSTTGLSTGVYGSTAAADGYSGMFIGGVFFTTSKVGIGTSTPVFKFQVKSEIDGNWIAGIHNSSTLTNGHGLVVRADGGNPIQVQGATGTCLFTVLQNGYTGMGTASPVYPLHLVSNYNPTWLAGFHNPSFLSTSNGLLVRADGGNPFLVQTASGTLRFLVLQNGNVGIGDAAPEYRLVVNAPSTTSTGIGAFRNMNGENKVVIRQNSNGSGAVNIYKADQTATISLLGEGESYLNSGNFGIGTTNPGYLLQVGVAGDGTQARANAWNLLSDARLKKDLVSLNNPLDLVEQINGYYFYWNTGTDKTRQFGILAQEVQRVLPEIVSEGEDGYLSVEYGKITPLLIESIKALKAENDQLKERLKAIEGRLGDIEGR